MECIQLNTGLGNKEAQRANRERMSKAGFQKRMGNRLPVSRGSLREDSTKAPGLCRAWLKIIAVGKRSSSLKT